MRKVIGIVLLFALHSQLLAGWGVKEKTDAMTDEVKKTAFVRNDVGHTFSVYRISSGGAVWGNFALSDNVFEQVDWAKPPVFRVDKHEPKDLATLKKLQKLGVHAYEWQPRWVNFLLWHGKDRKVVSKSLVQLMEGQRLVVRYYLSTGGYKDTSFSLTGAASSISQAVGVSAKIDHSAQQKNRTYLEAYSSETNKCVAKRKEFDACMDRVSLCGKRANKDAVKFRECLR